jgi:hypothetical protein
VLAVAWVAEGAASHGLIIRLIIRRIRLDRTRSVWTDEASDVSSPDPSGADQIDAEHQATDLVVRPLCANLLDSAGLGLNSSSSGPDCPERLELR